MATLLMLDGFEHGRAASGVGGVYDTVVATPAVVTTPVRTGARSLEISAAAAAESVAYTIAAGSRVVTMAFYVRFASLPAADSMLAEWTSNANGRLYYDQSENKFMVSAAGSNDTPGGPTLATNTWYRIVMEYDASGASKVLRCRVDNGVEFSSTTVSAAADVTAVRLGTSSAHTYTGYFDDWLVSVTDGDYEDIGGWNDHKVESLIPSADGTHNITTSGDFDSFTATAFSNATTTGNTFIGHRPLQAANTANQVIRQELGTTANYMEFTLENLASNAVAIAGVRAYATHIESASSGASLGEAQLLLSDDTVVLTTGSIDVINSTEDPGITVTIRKRMTIAPSGGWDGTKVDGLKCRVGFGDNAPDVNFIDFMVEVASFTQRVDGVVLTATPSLPAGAVTAPGGAQQVDGLVLTVTPSLPAGALKVSLTGVVLSATPTLPAGALKVSLTGVALTATPSLPAGALKVSLTGVALTASVSLPAGSLAHRVQGAALTASPSLPAGALVAPITVTGVVLTLAPSLPVGSLAVPQNVTGVALVLLPTLPAGLVSGLLQRADHHVTEGGEPHAAKTQDWARADGARTADWDRVPGAHTTDHHRS